MYAMAEFKEKKEINQKFTKVQNLTLESTRALENPIQFNFKHKNLV